jgi:hypothetical protein
MWPITGSPVPNTWFNLEPVTVLYDFDGPRIFTCHDSVRNLYLAYQCGEDDRATRFLVVPFNEFRQAQLTKGMISLRDALLCPRAWVVDVLFDGTMEQLLEINTTDIPADVLPRAGVMLYASLPSLINPEVPLSIET